MIIDHLLCFNGHTQRIWSIAWSPIDDIFATSGADSNVKIWRLVKNDTNDNKKIIKFVDYTFYTPHSIQYTICNHFKRSVRCVKFSSDGKYLLCASFDSNASVWSQATDSNEWNCLATLEGHENEVKCISINSTGRYIATCGRDKTVWVYEKLSEPTKGNTKSNEALNYFCSAILTGHTHDLWDDQIYLLDEIDLGPGSGDGFNSGDESKIYSAGSGIKTKNWYDKPEWNCFWIAAVPYVLCLHIFITMLHFPDGLIATFLHSRPRLLQAICVSFNFWQEILEIVGFSAAGKQSNPKAVVQQSAPTKAAEQIAYNFHVVLSTQDVKYVAWNPMVLLLVSASYDNSIRVWGLEDNEWVCIQILNLHENTVWCLSFNPDGTQFASCSSDLSVIIYESKIVKEVVNTNKLSQLHLGLYNSPMPIHYPATLLSSNKHKHTPIRADDWAPIHVYGNLHKRPIFSVDYRQYILTGSGDNTIKIIKPNSEFTLPLANIKAHDLDVNCVAWKPYDTEFIFASVSDDEYIKLWRFNCNVK